MSTYNQLLHKYRKDFKEKDISLQTLKLFLFELCNEKDVDLYVKLDEEALPEIEEKFERGIPRLLKEEPLNYVLGYSYFFGYKMIVNDGVLIPRYETEELVGFILGEIDLYKPEGEIVLADIGTGSGAIAIALKKEEERLKVYASDISKEALDVAKINASSNDADIAFLEGSMLEPLKERDIKLDILVSNPPYIPSVEKIEDSVYDYEPHVALFGGEDGLKFYREIFENAKDVLKEKGMLFFEIGYDQAERLTALAKTYFPDGVITVKKDINGKDRMLEILL
ncbi:MAG: peptide chain release factor N(5)-glutamine methyltransferase [Erysipelotrichaceae bacterium]|nr:peptide chain release factor N(5)-glutamine methyltransferase [Erysipelotrichaceae bacterium]